MGICTFEYMNAIDLHIMITIDSFQGINGALAIVVNLICYIMMPQRGHTVSNMAPRSDCILSPIKLLDMMIMI